METRGGPKVEFSSRTFLHLLHVRGLSSTETDAPSDAELWRVTIRVELKGDFRVGRGRDVWGRFVAHPVAKGKCTPDIRVIGYTSSVHEYFNHAMDSGLRTKILKVQ